MDASLLRFTGEKKSAGNAGIAALKKQLRTVKDSADQQVWKFVGRGIGVPGFGEADPQVMVVIQDYQSPGILIYDVSDEHIVDAAQFVDAEVTMRFRLYCFINVEGSDMGHYPDVQALRRNITKATLRALRPVSADNLTGWDVPQIPFDLDAPQRVRVDYDDNLRTVVEGGVVTPWWSWRIDLSMTFDNIHNYWTDRDSTMIYSQSGANGITVNEYFPIQGESPASVASPVIGTTLVVPVPGTFTHASVKYNTVETGAPDSYMLNVNGADLGYALTVATGSTSGSHVNLNVHADAGDLVCWHCTAGGLSPTLLSIGLEFIPD